MWIENNYRRNLMDMHIDDWNKEFLSKIDCNEYVNALKEANIQAAMVKAKSHTGLCYYPTSVGRMHEGLNGKDFLGEMIQKCHESGIAVITYFTQVFDNWAYENHLSWRCITEDGKQFREFRNQENFKNGRYGIVCPNNEEYREYVKCNLQELNRNYDFEGMFLDMTFWPDICYCSSCRERYMKETGREMPRMIDWKDKEFIKFQLLREKWMADYAKFATKSVKEIKPSVTIEHQFSMITSPWINASSEYLADAVDYSGGDYYGGFLQQTFINKYYKNVSPNLPFIYHTSRCDPELDQHTTTKTEEELLLHVITALVHNGAFLLVDAINPDGTIVKDIYCKLMKKIFDKTMQYEKTISGELVHDVAIWFATHSKYDPNETGISMSEKTFKTKYYLESPVQMAAIMRSNNIPFDVIGSRNLKTCKCKTLVLSHVSHILDEEMDDIEAFVQQGGSLYISGTIGNKRLAQLLGVTIKGRTEHTFTYMSPTDEGKAYLKGFAKKVPLTIAMHQYLVDLQDNDCKILATLTLPYTETNTEQFAAIHSNPPGIYTEQPAIILKNVGLGKILWTAAPIEIMKPYMSRQVVKNLMVLLTGEMQFTSNAPKFVEVIGWKKAGKLYFAALNQQEEPPIVPIYDIYIDLPGTAWKARMTESAQALDTEVIKDITRIYLPKLEVFHIIEVDKG